MRPTRRPQVQPPTSTAPAPLAAPGEGGSDGDHEDSDGGVHPCAYCPREDAVYFVEPAPGAAPQDRWGRRGWICDACARALLREHPVVEVSFGTEPEPEPEPEPTSGVDVVWGPIGMADDDAPAGGEADPSDGATDELTDGLSDGLTWAEVNACKARLDAQLDAPLEAPADGGSNDPWGGPAWRLMELKHKRSSTPDGWELHLWHQEAQLIVVIGDMLGFDRFWAELVDGGAEAVARAAAQVQTVQAQLAEQLATAQEVAARRAGTSPTVVD